MLINKVHFPVTVLGPGKRIGIWTQGCGIRCPNCISRDTWDSDNGHKVSVSQLVDWCHEIAHDNFDGITITGGEPFDQPAELNAFLVALHKWRCDSRHDFDILCYSGFPFEKLKNQHSEILEKLDALIPEPFVRTIPGGKRWRGSQNQELITLSDRGQLRFGRYVDSEPIKKMQLSVVDGRIWYIGIPQKGDMERFQEICQRKGLNLEASSWRA